MFAGIMAAASAGLGWYYPRWVVMVSNRVIAGLLGSVGALVVVVLLMAAGLTAAGTGLISRSSSGLPAVSFSALALVSILQRAVPKWLRTVRYWAGRHSEGGGRDNTTPRFSSPRLGLNWTEGLIRSWMALSVIWAAVVVALHFAAVQAGQMATGAAIGSSMVWSALPPLLVGAAGLALRWIVAGFRGTAGPSR